MTGPSWRCRPALIAAVWALAVPALRAASWAATFPGAAGQAISAVVPVEDGRHFVALAAPGTRAEGGRLLADGKEVAAKVFVDPVSRLVVFRATTTEAVPVPSLRAAAPLGSGFPVQAPDGGRGVTDGWVKQVGDKVLPLSLLKIRYTGAAPPPGTPLADGEGRVAAIACHIAGPGQGYALPVEVVRRVLDGVARDGAVAKAWLGLSLSPEAKTPQVQRVVDDSPASRAGVRVADVLLEIGGRPVEDYADAVNAFYFLRPATTVRMKVRRDGAEVAISVTPESAAK